ncbi:MAG: DNRLRE domain-containing protein [Aureliella sp.]
MDTLQKQIRQRFLFGSIVCASVVWLLLVSAVSVADEPGKARSRTGRSSEQTVSFQNGFNGYKGTVDTEIWALASKTHLHKNPNASSDANNDGGESQVLMRFDEIIGNKAGQIPPHSTILSAKLIVSAFDQGTTVNLHRMLVPFPECATWDSMVSGVSADGYEASRHKDGFTFGKIAASSSGAIFDVRDTIQLWVNGRKNHGWVFLNTGGNGWDFYVSEFERKDEHPKLVVRFVPPKKKTSNTKVAVSPEPSDRTSASATESE